MEEQIEREGFEAKKRRNTEPQQQHPQHRNYSESPVTSYGSSNSPGYGRNQLQYMSRETSPESTTSSGGGGLRWKSGPSRSDTYIRGQSPPVSTPSRSPQGRRYAATPNAHQNHQNINPAVSTPIATPHNRYTDESPRIKSMPSLHKSMSKSVAPMTPLSGGQVSRESFGLQQQRNQFRHTPIPHASPSPSPSTSSYVQSLKRCTSGSVPMSPSIPSSPAGSLQKFNNGLFNISNNKH